MDGLCYLARSSSLTRTSAYIKMLIEGFIVLYNYINVLNLCKTCYNYKLIHILKRVDVYT